MQYRTNVEHVISVAQENLGNQLHLQTQNVPVGFVRIQRIQLWYRKWYLAVLFTQIKLKSHKSWWARRESNPRPIGYEPTALTPELRAREARIAF